mmetsp:Transcript_5207/g.7735  ORF Transcript_5207/g.7735 Transcript_5207/m.7735 type:complete len:86 (-) Transcript_5207:8-265(-)
MALTIEGKKRLLMITLLILIASKMIFMTFHLMNQMSFKCSFERVQLGEAVSQIKRIIPGLMCLKYLITPHNMLLQSKKGISEASI